MRDRRTLLLALLVLAPGLTGCTGRGGESAPEVHAAHSPAFDEGGRVLFDMMDPRGDDRGTGRYEYPTSFQGRFGFLDVTRFRVLDSGNFVTFLVEFRRPISRRRDDGSTEAKGYWLPLVDIYIDRDGRQESGYDWALPGRNVRFDLAGGWEKMVLVTPGNSRSLELMLRNRTSDLELVNARHDIVIPQRVVAQAYDLKIVVPKSDLGGNPQPDWGYQVLAMAYEPGNLAANQLQNGRVQRFPSDAHFGGGTDFEGDPNVIDLLAPSEAEQYRWLSDFRASPYAGATRFATIPMIRAQGPSGVGGGPTPRVMAPAPAAAPAAPGTPAGASTPPGRAGVSSTSPLMPRPPPPRSSAVTRDPSAPGPDDFGPLEPPESPTDGPFASEFSFELDPGAKD